MRPDPRASQGSIRRFGIGLPDVAAAATRLGLCVLASVLLSLCAALAQAQPQEPSAPRPVFPALTGRVVDTAKLIDAATEGRLDGMLAAHEAATTDQVVVVTLPSLGGMAVEDFGYQLGRSWGIGQRGKNNGVLLIVSRDDRKLRIEVGYGLEGKLTDADAAVIINQTITPAFKRNDYAGGIEQGAAAILQRLNPPPMSDAPSDHSHPAPVVHQVQTVSHISETFIGFVAVIFGGFILVMFLIFHGHRFRRKPPKPETLILGAAAASTARRGRGKTSATRSSSASSSSSSRSSSSSSSSSSSRSSSRGGGGSFGGGGASGGW